MFGLPDFGHSDIWHFNFALKFLLAKALKNGYFPFWSKDIGAGFPLLGEGQTGIFNLYNLLAFKFLNPVLAFNLGYLVIFLTAAAGSYLFGRVIKFSKLASLYLAIIFSLSGVFVTQVNHFNLIQAASFLPWEFFLAEKFLQSNQKRWLFFLSVMLQQQIFAGFQQSTLISIIGVTSYLLLRLRQEKKFLAVIPFLLSLALGLVISLPQIIPSQALIKLSSRSAGIPIAEMARFPFQPKMLLSFFSPYLFGNPALGQNKDYNINASIFWESTGYLGLLPLMLVPLGLLNNKFRKNRLVFVTIGVISLILLLGSSTPFFFVFQIPPLSYFRVPARFLLLFVWILALLAATGLANLKNKKLAVLIFLISFANLLYFAFTYLPVIAAQKWLAEPETAKLLKNDNGWYRVFSVTPAIEWNKIFYKKGWSNIDDYYPFRNALDPNQNLFWSIPSVDYYTAAAPRRLEIFHDLISRGVNIDPQNNRVFVSSESAKILSLAGVKFLISAYPLSTESGSLNFYPVATSSGSPTFTVYQNPAARPHTYLTSNYQVVSDLAGLGQALIDSTNSATIVEEAIPVKKSLADCGQSVVTKNEDLEVAINVSAIRPCLLILSDSYYPGWQARLDSTSTKIYPANLNQRAVVVPAGRHALQFSYHPFN